MYDKIIAITNRRLCAKPLIEQVERIASLQPASIILREKDLAEEDYAHLAEQVMKICSARGVPCTLHAFHMTAARLGCPRIHLSMDGLRKLGRASKCFEEIGASVHSPGEAVEAMGLGATYVTAGHIFDTDCKKGLPGRGLSYLKSVCDAVDLPVYAIGGITWENLPLALSQGAAGGCMMSQSMRW